MTRFQDMSQAQLQAELRSLRARHAAFRNRGLSLNMARGKPCPEQLDLSASLLECLSPQDYRAADGTDCRNYGGLDGLPEAKELFAEYLEVAPEEIIVGGNSSLALMHDAVARAMSHGVPGGPVPWGRLEGVRFLCPCPGYDRHFSICQHFGIEMVAVPMRPDGPDMDAVEVLAAKDESVKGIWCVPMHSNPTGVTFSDEVVDRLAGMETKAADFRIFWDNAYAVHHLTETPPRLKNILAACKRAGHPDRVLMFGSTSKVTFPGAGVAMVAGSVTNMEDVRRHLFYRTIGPDKLNQLRHVRFLRDMAGIAAHMKKHAAILRPKFEAVQRILEAELGGKGIACWSRPAGGYFVSLDTLEGCARRVVELAAQAGLTLTGAGATFPLGHDPRDCNIRIAPTFPSLALVEQAMELVGICVQLAAAEKLLG